MCPSSYHAWAYKSMVGFKPNVPPPLPTLKSLTYCISNFYREPIAICALTVLMKDNVKLCNSINCDSTYKFYL